MQIEADIVLKEIDDSIHLTGALAAQKDTILEIAHQISQAFRRGNKLLIFGNGGSASDAEHIASEMAGKFTMHRDPLPAIALTTNTSALTAIANDFGYENVFSRQMKGLMSEGDVVVGISTSGESPNVVRAIEEAAQRGAITVAFTGAEGRLKNAARYVISVPSTNTPRVQETHIVAGHIICGLVERALFSA